MTLSYAKVIDEAIEYLLDIRSIKKAKDAIWEAYYELGTQRIPPHAGLTVLILVAPCYGFGDIIFGIKLGTYMRQWYGCNVYFLTTHTAGFEKMGELPSSIITLASKSKNVECRRFANLVPNRPIPIADLIFVAPVPTNYGASLEDVRKMLKGATEFNTFFFSEYNHPDSKTVDFPTGIGGKNLGIFLADKTNSKLGVMRPDSLKNPFAIAYISDTVPSYSKCLYSFIEMIAAKYSKKYKILEVIVPIWVCEDITRFKKSIINKVSKHYPNIDYIDSDKKRSWLSDSNNDSNLFTIRCDVFPVPNNEMLQMIKYSIPDILLTGDQSLTDALSCCPTKNIWYQIAPWKEGLGKALAKYLPQKYLTKKSTSCGSVSALNFKSGYSKFINDWSFRKLAKPKLDAIILAALARKNSIEIQELENLISHTRRLAALKAKVRDM